MSNIPPKQPMKGARSPNLGQNGFPQDDESVFAQSSADSPIDDAMAEPGALVSIHQAALHANAESFPVLKSFQDYIEAERARARRRMTMMAGMFVAMMLIVVTGFIVGGVFLFNYMSRQQDALIEIALNRANVPATKVAGSDIAPAKVAGSDIAPVKTAGAESAPIAPAMPAIEVANTESIPAEPAIPATKVAGADIAPANVADSDTAPAEVAGAESAPIAPAMPAVEVANTEIAPAIQAEEIANTDIAPVSPAEEVANSETVAETPRREPIESIKVTASVEPPPEGFAAETVYVPSPAFGDERIPWKYLLPTK